MKLDLENCSSLRRLDCYNNQLIFLNLVNCSELKNVNCYKNKFTNLEFGNSPELEELCCSDNQLSSLGLNNNPQLEKLDCHNNQLTSLDITNCGQLERLDCHNNTLQDLFLPFQVWKLGYLNAKNNNFPEQDLSIFRKFVNLRELLIGNGDEKNISQGIYSRFRGSLEPLQLMERLKEIDVSNTDISSGLAYLSESINSFHCLTDLRKDAQVKIIANDLNNEPG